jgi:hypothetical protein
MSSLDDQSGGFESFRSLTEDEHALIERLLSADFEGREALAEQLEAAVVRRIDADGSLEFAPSGGPPAHTARRIPVEAEFEDEDGVTVHLLLHVLDGLLNELEVFREDSKPLLAQPSPLRLRLVVL